MNYLKKKQEQQPKKKKKNRRRKGHNQAPANDEDSSDSSSNSSPTHKPSKNNRKNRNKNDGKGDHLLLNLMQKNQKEGEFTPEQKTLYDAFDILMAEYKRRKDQRHRVGGLFKRNRGSLKKILQNAVSKCHAESDLQLKMRSKDLQNRRREINKKKKLTSFAAIADANRI